MDALSRTEAVLNCKNKYDIVDMEHMFASEAGGIDGIC